MLKLGGPGGLSLADLMNVGAAIPSTYSKSKVSPVLVGRTVSPWLSVFESNVVGVELQDPDAGWRM